MLTQYQLKNKMKVLLIESHKAPVVAVQVWVKTGSADEKKKEEGISHFIEHLVFKGTKKFNVGEIARTVEGSGGELNAFTTFDHTVFHVTMSKNDLETGLEVLSEMMGSPRFDEGEIDREREVVIEEIKRSFDNPHQVASQQLFSTVFKKHPYGIPIIGFERNIRDVSKKKLVQYYQSRYVPSNMTLVIVGDFQKNNIKKLIEDHYAGFKKNKLKKIKRVAEPKQKKFFYNYKTTEFQEAALNIAFKAPSAKHKDIPAMDALSLIMGGGDSSRLVQSLRLKKHLVQSVSAGSYNPLDAGLYAISAHFKIANVKEVFDALQRELQVIMTSPVAFEELERAKLNLQSDEIYSLESVDGLARKVGTFQTLLNDPLYIEKYLKGVAKLTPKDILVIAKKYFDPKQMSVTILLNKRDELNYSQKEFFERSQDFSKSLAVYQKTKVKVLHKKVKSPLIKVPLKLNATTSNIKKYELSSGAKVILKKNIEVPVINVKVGFLGGARLENAKLSGITTLTSNTWTCGTNEKTEEQIASIIESSAASLSAFGGRNSMGISLDTIKSYFDKTSEVFADVLLSPVFPQAAVSREAMVQKEHLINRADNPSSVVILKFMENIFAGHPYSQDLLGKEDFLNVATTEQVKSFLSQSVSAANAVFVATGDLDEDKTLKYFEEISKTLRKGKKHDEVFKAEPLGHSKKIYSPLTKEQSHIVVGYRGLTLKDERRYALNIIQAILAGQGGRLFLELRDKASLAYTVAPIHMDGMEEGYFGAYIGCSPEKGKKAVEMIGVEFQKMVEKAPSYDEVERAKKYLVGQNHIGLQRNSSQATSILFDEIYGIDSKEAFQFYEKIKDISPSDIHKLSQELFQAETVTVAVGPICPWD